MAANVAYGAPAKKAKVDGKVSPQTEEAPKTVSVVGPYGLLTSKTRGHLGCDAAKLRLLSIERCAWPPGMQDMDGVCLGRYV